MSLSPTVIVRSKRGDFDAKRHAVVIRWKGETRERILYSDLWQAAAYADAVQDEVIDRMARFLPSVEQDLSVSVEPID